MKRIRHNRPRFQTSSLGSEAGRVCSGFTLLEVLLAMTIFAICMSAIYVSFRIGVKSFESGRRSAEVFQSVRFTADQITRDLRAVCFETNYNRRYLDLSYQMKQRENDLLDGFEKDRDGDLWAPESSYGGAPADPTQSVSYLGTQMNLRFIGMAKEHGSTLEFARAEPSDGSDDRSVAAIERVRYFLGGADGTSLYRARARALCFLRVNPNLEEEIIRARERRESRKINRGKKPLYRTVGGSSGKRRVQVSPETVVPAPNDPLFDVNYVIRVPEESFPPELVAENVVEFKLTYGYFFGEWHESDLWDSESKKHRTPAFRIPEDDLSYLAKLMAYRLRPYDGLPSYVRLRLAVRNLPGKKESEDKESVQRVETIIWIPAALETYVPDDMTLYDPDQKNENESTIRSETEI